MRLLKIIMLCFIVNFCGYSQQNTAVKNSNKLKDSLAIINTLSESFKLALKGDFIQAIDNCERVINNDTLNDYPFKARAYSVLGVAFSEINRQDGRAYFEKSLEIYEKNNDSILLITAYNNLGKNYTYQKKYAEAKKYFKKSTDIVFLLKNDKFYNSVYNYAETVLIVDHDANKALKILNDNNIIDKAKTSQKINALGEVYKVYGEIYNYTKEYKKAHDYYDKAIDIFKQKEYSIGLKDVYKLQSDLYYKQKNIEKGNFYLDKYIDVFEIVNQQQQKSYAKKIEAEIQIKENQERLNTIIKEKKAKQALLSRTRILNIFLSLGAILLLITAYTIYRKNKELNIAKNRAEKLSEAKSDFYSEISHELRTPLYAVIELSSILLKENNQPKHNEYLKSLNFSGMHLLALVNNVLQLNKTEYSDFKLQRTDFNLKTVITSVLDSLEFALSDSKNTIHLNYDKKIPKVLVGDSLKLTQVLINLISNAVKFTNNGKIKVKVKKIEDLDSQVNIHFSIADNGQGISKEGQAKIFQDFYQDQAKSKSTKGTGLGLSIVKRILEAMGSKIEIESELGKGSKFYFDLLFDKKQSDTTQDDTLASYLNIINDCNFLIVDDNKVNQLVTKKILDQYNLKSKVASGGAEAINMVKTYNFDCVLMDLHMPEIDGYQATNKIREFNTDVAIIALTAASKEEVLTRIQDYDMQGYVMKPFSKFDFIKQIAKSITIKQINTKVE